MARLAEADALLICVPTPLNESRDPDLIFVEKTAEADRRRLTSRPVDRAGEHDLSDAPRATSCCRSCRKAASSRGATTFWPTAPNARIRAIPTTRRPAFPRWSAARCGEPQAGPAALLRRRSSKSIPVSSLEVAEACKILENTYRAVNIALVNELKMLYDRMGIDVWEVIDAAKTKPFGFQAFYPGPGARAGTASRSIPFYLTWLARKQGLPTRFIELAGEINSRMPEYVVTRLAEALNDVEQADQRQPDLPPGDGLQERRRRSARKPVVRADGMLLRPRCQGDLQRPAHSRVCRDAAPQGARHDQHRADAEFLASQDCMLIATDHSAYDYDFIVQHAKLVIDTRNATKNVKQGREKIHKA